MRPCLNLKRASVNTAMTAFDVFSSKPFRQKTSGAWSSRLSASAVPADVPSSTRTIHAIIRRLDMRASRASHPAGLDAKRPFGLQASLVLAVSALPRRPDRGYLLAVEESPRELDQ